MGNGNAINFLYFLYCVIGQCFDSCLARGAASTWRRSESHAVGRWRDRRTRGISCCSITRLRAGRSAMCSAWPGSGRGLPSAQGRVRVELARTRVVRGSRSRGAAQVARDADASQGTSGAQGRGVDPEQPRRAGEGDGGLDVPKGADCREACGHAEGASLRAGTRFLVPRAPHQHIQVHARVTALLRAPIERFACNLDRDLRRCEPSNGKPRWVTAGETAQDFSFARRTSSSIRRNCSIVTPPPRCSIRWQFEQTAARSSRRVLVPAASAAEIGVM